MFKIKKSRPYKELKKISLQYVGTLSEHVYKVENFTKREIKIFERKYKAEIKKQNKQKKIKRLSKYEMLRKISLELESINSKLSSVIDYGCKGNYVKTCK